MIPRDYSNTGWLELHAIRNRLRINMSKRLLKNKPSHDIDAQLRLVQKAIDQFNLPPYMKRPKKEKEV